MAKLIKFNLILDGNPIRTIEQLQDNFSLEDILSYYNSGMLLRWLEVRGFTQQFEAVSAIDKSADIKTVITRLVEIFEMDDVTAADIEEKIEFLTYQKKERMQNAQYQKAGYAKQQILLEYHKSFKKLVDDMIANKQNMAILKAAAAEMERNYSGAFCASYYQLFLLLLENAPKAIFAMLTRETFRKVWLEGLDNYPFTKEIEKKISNKLQQSTTLQTLLDTDVKFCQRKDSGFVPIIEPGNKIMVLYLSDGAYIRNSGVLYEKMSKKDVEGKFPLLNGLDYNSNGYGGYKLLYMEV